MRHDAYRGAYILLQEGWAQYSPAAPVNGVVCYCAGGAIAQALVGDPRAAYNPNFELSLLLHGLADYVGVRRRTLNTNVEISAGQRVFMWNDHPGQTKENVLRTFEELISSS